jgi:uncharacterized protein YlxW (UPF0749 family)
MFSPFQLASFGLGFGVWALAFLHNAVSTGDLLVIIGAVVFAAASFRTATNKALRDNNTDLRARNEQLETSTTHLLARVQELENQPNLTSHQQVLERMSALLGEQTKMLRSVHQAVVPPEYRRE